MTIVRTIGVGAAAVTVLVAVNGCEPRPEPLEQQDDDESAEFIVIEPMVDDSDEEPEQVEPSPVDFAATWPGEANYDSFDLMWLGGDEPIELYEEPDVESEVIGSARWIDGEQFGWIDTMVRIEQPREYRAEQGFTYEGTPYDEEFGQLALEDQSFEVEADQPVFAYRYAGEQGCYLGIDDQVVYGDCPVEELGIDENFDELDAAGKWNGQARQWWVKVDSDDGPGWFRPDEGPVEVHPRKVEGYDEVDAPFEP